MTAKTAPRMTEAQCAALYEKAHAAGMAAGDAAIPVPMHVVELANPFDDNSPVVRQYAPVMDGPCGFASVVIRPGNSSFARYMKAKRGARKAYYGGTQMWVHEFGQSVTRKYAYAGAFARVVSEAGVFALPESRMD